MPYYVTKKHPECSGWATVKRNYEILGCHKTRAAAIKQMVALSIAEDIPPGGTHPRDEAKESPVTTEARKALWSKKRKYRKKK